VFKIIQMEDPGIPAWISNIARTPDWELHDEFWSDADDESDDGSYYYYGRGRVQPTMGDPHNSHKIPKRQKGTDSTPNEAELDAKMAAQVKTGVMRASVDYLKQKLTMSKGMLIQQKYIEKRHRNLAERLHTKVNLRGALSNILIGAVSCLSVWFIKTMFDNQVHRPI